MFEHFLIKKFFNKNNIENYSDESTDSTNYTEYIWSFIWACINFGAAYMSWTCKQNQEYNIPVRVIYAIIAYILGPFYILFYLIGFKEACTKGIAKEP
jgi:hypothetical protein